jgi:hypothetical protein
MQNIINVNARHEELAGRFFELENQLEILRYHMLRRIMKNSSGYGIFNKIN